jgi:hypothetical protein
MSNIEEIEASEARLKRFAEIYQVKMEQKPLLEIIARYAAMTEAVLTVREREKADVYLDTNRLSELLNPGKRAAINKS